MWKYLEYIYEAILGCHGGNLYPLHRPKDVSDFGHG